MQEIWKLWNKFIFCDALQLLWEPEPVAPTGPTQIRPSKAATKEVIIIVKYYTIT